MKKALVLLIFISYLSSYAQHKKHATKNASGDLVGLTAREDFNQVPYQGWFTKNYESYTLDNETINELKKGLKGIKIKAFMGTWCHDSERETPHFYKILAAAHFNLKNLEMITVNRSKRTPDDLQKDANLFRVPTFIFYKNGKEIGRYVEFARESLEKDMLKIVTGKPYKNSYE